MSLSSISTEADSLADKAGNMDTGGVSNFLSNNDNIIILIIVLLVAFVIFRKAFKFLALIGIVAAGLYFFAR